MRHPHSGDNWGRAARLAEIPFEERKAASERRMAIIDALPLGWRLLVHKYGWVKVRQLIKAGFSPEAAEAEIIRREKQTFRTAELACLADELILE